MVLVKNEEIVAVAYGRVSKDREDQLNSLSAQINFFRNYIKEHKYKTYDGGVLCKKDGTREVMKGIYADEGISGTRVKGREAFKQLMKDAQQRKFNLILTKSVQRFSRNVEDLSKATKDLKEWGVYVYFDDLKVVTSDPKSEMIINMFAVLAQEESASKSRSVQFGIREAQKAGKWTTGTPPYGYDIVDGFLHINEEKSKIVTLIYDLFYYKGYGTGKIARYLNAQSIPTQKDTKWSQVQVCRVLDNHIYTGRQIQHKRQTIDINRDIEIEIPEDEWIVRTREDLRIIEDELFSLVQMERKVRRDKSGEIVLKSTKEVDENGDTSNRRQVTVLNRTSRHSNTHLFSNVLFCGNCGGALKRKKRNSKGRQIGYEWCCRMNDMYGKDRCGYRNSFAENELIAYVKNEINRYKSEKESLEHQFKHYYLYTYYEQGNMEEEIEELTKQIEKLSKKRKLNFELFSEDEISKHEYLTRNNEIENSLVATNSQLNRLLYLEEEIEQATLKYNSFINFLESVDTVTLTNATLRKIVSSIEVTTVDEVLAQYLGVKDNHKSISIEWNFLEKSENEILDDMVQKDLKKYAMMQN